MKSRAKRVGIFTVLITFIVLSQSPMIGTVAAQGCSGGDAGSVLACDASMDSYEDMLASMYSVAHTTLQYAGFITVFAGAIMWFTARRSSERAQTGVWLLMGGLGMILFYFGFEVFVQVIKWVAQGEGAA